MKKIWLILIFLLNLTPNISNGTFTLTGMNKMFAQLGVNEFICEDEFGESFDSSVPCDMIACVSTCQTCGEQGICEDDHVCPDVECETCGEFYPAGGFHECSSIRCSQCGIDYYPVKGHYCSGGNEGSGGNESGNEGDNSSGNGQGNTPVVPPYTPPSTPVNPPTPTTQSLPSYTTLSTKFQEVSKLTASEVCKKIGGNVYYNYQNWPDQYNNACALRISYALNLASANIPYEAGITISGDANSDGTKEWYYYKVADLVNYLNHTYSQCESYETDNTVPSEIAGRVGIICYQDCNWSDATGHIDIWDGTKSIGTDYYNNCGTVSFWELK